MLTDMKRILVSLFLLALVPLQTNASVQTDGTGDGYAKTGASSALAFTGNFTIAMWFKTSSASGIKRQYQLVGTASNISPNYAGGTLNFDATTETAGIAGGGPGADSAWHSFVVVRSGSTVTAYFDNVSFGTDTMAGTMPVGSPSLSIFAGGASGNDPMANGTLYSRMALYSSAWSSGDRSSYQSTGGCTQPASGAVAKYLFDSSGTLNTDSSASGLTLTPQGTGAGWTYSTDEPASCAGPAVVKVPDLIFIN